MQCECSAHVVRQPHKYLVAETRFQLPWLKNPPTPCRNLPPQADAVKVQQEGHMPKQPRWTKEEKERRAFSVFCCNWVEYGCECACAWTRVPACAGRVRDGMPVSVSAGACVRVRLRLREGVDSLDKTRIVPRTHTFTFSRPHSHSTHSRTLPLPHTLLYLLSHAVTLPLTPVHAPMRRDPEKRVRESQWVLWARGFKWKRGGGEKDASHFDVIWWRENMDHFGGGNTCLD